MDRLRGWDKRERFGKKENLTERGNKRLGYMERMDEGKLTKKYSDYGWDRGEGYLRGVRVRKI